MLAFFFFCVFIGIIIFAVLFEIRGNKKYAEEQVKAQAERESNEKARQDALLARAEQLISQPLQSVPAPFSLKRGEVCYFSAQAVLLENRKVRVGTAFAGPTISIPLVKALGLRFRAGYFAHAPNSQDQLVPLDQGTLSITNRSLIFIGENGSKTVKLSDILRIDKGMSPNPDVIPFLLSITKRAGRTQFYAIEDPLPPFIILMKMTNASLS